MYWPTVQSSGLEKRSGTNIFFLSFIYLSKHYWVLTKWSPNSYCAGWYWNLCLVSSQPLGRLGQLSLWNELSCYLTWVALVTAESLGCCWQSPVISRCSWEWTSKWPSVYVRSVRAAAVQPALPFGAHRTSWVTCCNFPDVCVCLFFFWKYDVKQKDSSSPLFTELLLVLLPPQNL